ncbi:hypothetical protein LWI29_005405 [Acer saccharum]|uniref:Uncharacterized protein n=1 Tax=Acer saccharum TaxID=4024 RepID=A0AA39VFC4_ACESA|nr:hypothetical protein LWI29_005405 [Acer saccharum]
MAWVDRFLGLEKEFSAPVSNSLPVLERSAGDPGKMNGEASLFSSPLIVKDRKQLIESYRLADMCCQVQNSNKKGKADMCCQVNGKADEYCQVQNSNVKGYGCRKDESLAIKSTYSKLRKVKSTRRVSFSRDGIEISVKARDVSSISDEKSDSSLLLNSSFGRGENSILVDDGLEGKECGFKVDGPSLGRPTQSIHMKARSVGMADLGPASSKYTSNVGKDRRSLDETEEVFYEANVDGVVRDMIVSENGDGGNIIFGHDQPIKRIGRMKNHLVKSHVPEVLKASWNLQEEIAKAIRAGRVLGFDFNGREKDMVEEIVRRIKAGTFGKLEGIMPSNNK